jgi:hypothetical protein
MRKAVYNSVASLLVLTAPEVALAAPKVGVASAVKNDVRGTLGGSSRALTAGSDVFTKERIRTGAESTAQILLLDKTSLTVGPRSEMTLDNFVYNPSRSTGQVVMSAIRGAFRFVSGSQAPQSYTIRTPVGTMGVRGTIGELFVGPGFAVFILVEGSLTVAGRLLTVPGTALIFQNGQWTGPVTWDGTLFNVGSGISFPLYGWKFNNEPTDNPLPGNNISSIDQLNAIIQGSITPPPIPPSGEGGFRQRGLRRR